MPMFNLIESPTEQRDLKAMMQTASISLDVAYPFTLAGRQN